MIGIAIELLISWLLLKWLVNQNLSVLGLKPTKTRLAGFLIAFLLPLVFLSMVQLILAWLGHNPFKINPAYSWRGFFQAVAYVLRAVAYEDLIFRGALLYILIHKIGATKALWISAVSFGIYHWFSWNVLGQPVQMLIVFITTGVTGYLFALSFKKTGSMYVPFALHFGIDFTSMILFSQDKQIGHQLLIKTFEKDPYTPGTFISIIALLIYFTGLPLLLFAYLKRIKPDESDAPVKTPAPISSTPLSCTQRPRA